MIGAYHSAMDMLGDASMLKLKQRASIMARLSRVPETWENCQRALVRKPSMTINAISATKCFAKF